MTGRVLNDFYEIEGNTLISNNYEAFNTDILEIRIQALYGERTLRPFTDTKIKLLSQNVVDMYSGYLKELFEFAQQYNILTPEMKETIRTMSYSRTNDDTRSIKTTTSDVTHEGIGVSTSNTTDFGGINTTIYGKNVETNSNTTTGEKGEDNYTDTTTQKGTSTTDTNDTNNETLTRNVSAYNQNDPTYTPREQDVTNGTSGGTSTLTNDLTNTTTHAGTYNKDGSDINNTHTADSGQDTLKINSNTKENGTQTTTSDGNKSGTADTDDLYNGSEKYDLNENITEKGRINYEEIIDTIENLFNPYDWLATKIVNTICEVIYYEKIK